MPIKYGKDSNFKAKKGRSGRPSVGCEIAKREAIIKSWNTVNNNASNISVALPIALKDMTDKTLVSGVIKQVYSEDTKNLKEVLDITNEYEERIRKQILE